MDQESKKPIWIRPLEGDPLLKAGPLGTSGWQRQVFNIGLNPLGGFQESLPSPDPHLTLSNTFLAEQQ